MILILIIPSCLVLQSMNLQAKVLEPNHWEFIHNDSFQFHPSRQNKYYRPKEQKSDVGQQRLTPMLPKIGFEEWCINTDINYHT